MLMIRIGYKLDPSTRHERIHLRIANIQFFLQKAFSPNQWNSNIHLWEDSSLWLIWMNSIWIYLDHILYLKYIFSDNTLIRRARYKYTYIQFIFFAHSLNSFCILAMIFVACFETSVAATLIWFDNSIISINIEIHLCALATLIDHIWIIIIGRI